MESRRLACGFEHGEPDIFARVDVSAGRGSNAHGKMNVCAVPAGDDDSGLACHSCVDRILCQSHAVNPVLRAGRDAANDVAWVDVFEVDLGLALAEILVDPLFEVDADVLQFLVSGGVAFFAGTEQILPCTFGDDDDGMSAFVDAEAEVLEKSVVAVESEWDFGDQDAVDLAAGNGSGGRDESGVAPHEFDQAYSIS